MKKKKKEKKGKKQEKNQRNTPKEQAKLLEIIHLDILKNLKKQKKNLLKMILQPNQNQIILLIKTILLLNLENLAILHTILVTNQQERNQE